MTKGKTPRLGLLLLLTASLVWPVAAEEQPINPCTASLALLDVQLAADGVTSTVENPNPTPESAFVVSDIEWNGQRMAIGVWLDMGPWDEWEIEVRFPSTITPFSVYLCDDNDEGSGIIDAPDPVITEIRDNKGGGNGGGNGNGNGNGNDDDIVRIFIEIEDGRPVAKVG